MRKRRRMRKTIISLRMRCYQLMKVVILLRKKKLKVKLQKLRKLELKKEHIHPFNDMEVVEA